jgi:hypothetical protein
LDYQLSRGTFYVEKEYSVYFPKMSFLLKEYSIRLRNHHERIEKGEASVEDEAFKEMKKDYVFRLKSEYSKECLSFSKAVEDKKYSFM